MQTKTLACVSVAILALLAGLLFLPLERGARRACEWFGGFSLSASNCVTRSCYASHTCGYRYAPGYFCQDIHAGANLVDVYVRLGEPSWVKDHWLIWPRGSADAGYVVATVDGERVSAIDCNVAERP